MLIGELSGETEDYARFLQRIAIDFGPDRSWWEGGEAVLGLVGG